MKIFAISTGTYYYISDNIVVLELKRKGHYWEVTHKKHDYSIRIVR
jgi:hypothetical protein